MGQEWSWPCASRDLQERKLAEGKYDFGFLEEGDAPQTDRESMKQKKIAKMEKILLYRNSSVDSTTPSPSIATPYSFTDDSYYDQDGNVVVVCEAIDDFEAFIASNMKKYNNVSIYQINLKYSPWWLVV